jgi:hypothetical protein
MTTTKRKLHARVPVLSDEYMAFTLLNVFDLFLTAFLMTVGHAEANPVGAHVLDRWGFSGFSLFKFGLVFVVVSGLEALFYFRPASATFLSRAAVFVYVALVLYEATLIAAARIA